MGQSLVAGAGLKVRGLICDMVVRFRTSLVTKRALLAKNAMGYHYIDHKQWLEASITLVYYQATSTYIGTLHALHMHTYPVSQVARTQTDRILRTLRTTRPTRHLHDRAEPLVSIPCSMATPVQRQGERSLQMCSLTRAHPKRQQLTAHRAAEPPAVTEHAEKSPTLCS